MDRHPSSRTFLILCALATLASRQAAAADAFTVNVLDATASTSLAATRRLDTLLTNTAGDTAPSSEASILRTDIFAPSPDIAPSISPDFLWGEATVTGLFDVTAFTANPIGPPQIGYEFSTAGAQSVVDFTPTASGIAPLQIALSGTLNWYYSSGAMSLTDQTTGELLWSYGWGEGRHDVPWTQTQGAGSALIELQQFFSDTDIYELSLATRTYANYDSERMNVTLSGLQAVPEPQSLILFGAGIVGLVARRRRT